MQVDDPPYLSVGTAVSAKYKGAFCEAKVNKVVRIVKCKVTYKMGLGSATVSDDQIKGNLRVGQLVQAKHPNGKDYVEATITKIQDCSQYTVVFDDGDITTLRRSALCLKSGRHFNESETLDQLPLTNPEHFGNPVMGGRRGRRNRQLKEDSSDGEPDEETQPDLQGYTVDIGRVVSVETTDKKRSKDNWFPGLVVTPSAQPTVRINVKDEYLIRSFKDGRYYTVPKKEVNDFSRELGEKVESPVLAEAVQKVLRYLNQNELPIHWERSSLFRAQNMESDSEENFTESSDDEPSEEKDLFVAQLYKFLDDAGTPLNKTPSINSKDIDLQRLFRIVHKLGGYNRVTNQNKWRTVTMGLKLTVNQNTFNQVKVIYKKCLLSYENFNRALGVTMLNHTRSTKKNSSRSLIRDKDRATPVNSPRPEKEDEVQEKKEEVKEVKELKEVKEVPHIIETKSKRKLELKKEIENKKKDLSEISDTNSSGDATDQSESVKDPRKSKRGDVKVKKLKQTSSEKVKAPIEKVEEAVNEEEKVQSTRAKSNSKVKEQQLPVTPEKKNKEEARSSRETATKTPKPSKKTIEDDKKSRGRKKVNDEKPSTSDVSESNTTTNAKVNIGDKLIVYYGPTHESKVTTYEAKVIQINNDQNGIVYLVHYTGWNTRYDEWITPGRIAENLSASSKAKRMKSQASTSKAPPVTPKSAGKRGRGASISGKTSTSEIPRSTTPSSVTSSSSRTKSPATPATRSASRLQTRQDYSRRTRRTSGQTDVSNHSDSESDGSESDSEELSRTRSGINKLEEPEIKTYKRKFPKPPNVPKIDKRKTDDDTEKEEDNNEKVQKRIKRVKKSPEKSTEESDEDTSNPPKGRDFDLNQIRSELKGFSKALKVPVSDMSEKEAVSSSDDSSTLPPEKNTDEESEDKKDKTQEKSFANTDDVYEFKEPEPFEFETRGKLIDEKTKKRLVPRLYEEIEEKSPKKKLPIKSPPKIEQKEVPNLEVDKKKSPSKKLDEKEIKTEDPFDSLVQSPSFNLVKSLDKTPPNKSSIVRKLDESLSMFNVSPNPLDEYVQGELSDTEVSNQKVFTQSTNIFSDDFSKSSPDNNTLEMEFSDGKTDESKLKDSDDDDNIRATVQLLIARGSSTDDDSNEPLLVTQSTSNYEKKKDTDLKVKSDNSDSEYNLNIEEKEKYEIETPREPSPMDLEPAPEIETPIVEKSIFPCLKQPVVIIKSPQTVQISPALQETDSSLMESIVATSVLVNTALEDSKDFTVKKSSGSKIADSILQKLNSIKKMEEKNPVSEYDEKEIIKEDIKSKSISDVKTITNIKVDVEIKVPPIESSSTFEEVKSNNDDKIKNLLENKPNTTTLDFDLELESKIEFKLKPTITDVIHKPEPNKSRSPSPTIKFDGLLDAKKRRKVLSKQYIEESDSDSSDSEQLVIARSDDDSQSNSMEISKLDIKESDSNISQIQSTDESQQQEERNFRFDPIKQESPKHDLSVEEDNKCEAEQAKEDEPDSQLHSLLLCEETIPRSPAPMPEVSNVPEPKQVKSVLEMPFASAPGTSNSKSILPDQKPLPKPAPQPIVVATEPLPRERIVAPNVLDHSPPSTPESTVSNLSPRGENEDFSPNINDNESCKSNKAEPYAPLKSNSTNKVLPYSEEDTQMTNEPNVKKRQEAVPAQCKKRRRSCRTDEVPVKRGRKPLNRSRHNSDSDDTSEHSTAGSGNASTMDRSRSPRPSKYDFTVELDPITDPSERIALILEKMTECRKTYADIRSELAIVERRRKKLRRREREAIKAAKQELACA